MKRQLILLLFFLLYSTVSFSQEVNPKQVYPKMVGFVSIAYPIASFDKNGSTFNFTDSYTVGFPIGFNILKSDKIGYCFAIIPYIKIEDGKDKISNFLFQPGVIFRYEHGFSFVTGIAFETSGRYGLTLALNKVVFETKNIKYSTALAVPFRFGNEKPPSVGLGIQFGIGF